MLIFSSKDQGGDMSAKANEIQSAAKHTPGPWVVCPELSAFDIKSESPKARTKLGDTHVIASATFTMNAPISADEFAANARLIAAAPDMADALRAILNVTVQDYSDAAVARIADKARAALAKAGL
jgi:hypothetical protein